MLWLERNETLETQNQVQILQRHEIKCRRRLKQVDSERTLSNETTDTKRETDLEYECLGNLFRQVTEYGKLIEGGAFLRVEQVMCGGCGIFR